MASVCHQQHQIQTSHFMSCTVKLCLYMFVVVPTPTRACETWNSIVSIHHKLDVFTRSVSALERDIFAGIPRYPQESHGNGFENAVSSRGKVNVGNGREWFYLRSRRNGCKHFRGVCVCIISLSVRNRVCELIDPNNRQLLVYCLWAAAIF